MISQPFGIVTRDIFITATESATTALDFCVKYIWTGCSTVRDEINDLMLTHFISVSREGIVINEECFCEKNGVTRERI